MMMDNASPSKGPVERPAGDPAGDLERLAAATSAPAGSTARRAPTECGHFDIHIARDGTWFYRGSPITRMSLVRLFSTVLRRDAAGTYWLVTPAERGRITVAGAPFAAVELTVRGGGQEQELIFRTNVDDTVAIDDAHPLWVVDNDATGQPDPYILVRDGLEARMTRPVFYELVELGREERVGDATLFGVWSKGRFFPLGRLDGP
jgi:hypothetical protein